MYALGKRGASEHGLGVGNQEEIDCRVHYSESDSGDGGVPVEGIETLDSGEHKTGAACANCRDRNVQTNPEGHYWAFLFRAEHDGGDKRHHHIGKEGASWTDSHRQPG